MLRMVDRGAFALLLLAWVATSTPMVAQDTLRTVERGVRVGITYTPGVRPGILILAGDRSTVLDSARLILGRDLDYSDEFEMITLPMGDSMQLRLNRVSGSADGDGEWYVNYALYAALGAHYAVNVHASTDSSLVVTLFDVRGEMNRREVRIPPLDPGDHDFRLEIHSAADEIVREVTGTPGVSSTRLLFINRGRIYRTDSDGADTAPISPAEVEAMSPTWAPDGRRAMYMEFPGTLYEHDIRTARRTVVGPTREYQNFTPEYAPDGKLMAFSRASQEGTDIFLYNLADQCCLRRLTVGRLYDNLSPSFSPDGRRIAFESTRSGFSQIYVMDADGSGQELFAPFDWGVTGASHAPDWSPDGLSVAFDREVERTPQIFVMDAVTQTVRQLTSFGRNTDPSWAPDGRHLAFVSDRTGSRQIWVIDIRTGRVRQVTRLGEARLPAWSPRIIEQF